MPRLFLIDGSSQMYRAYHAIRGLTGPDGRSTNAVYGFSTMLRKLIADWSPEYIAASFDLAGPTFRDDLHAEYKANRAPMPSDLAEQVPLVREACEALGVPVLTSDRFEADDVIGTLALQAAREGTEVTISTSDKDFAQLVRTFDGGGSIRLVNTMSGSVMDDDASVIAKFGVGAAQIIDMLALMGDAIDNIKGVDKCGPKTAAKWLAEYGTLEGVIANADRVGGKIGENLRGALPRLPLNRELVTIKTDVQLDAPAKSMTLRERDVDTLRTLYARYGFNAALRELDGTPAPGATERKVSMRGFATIGNDQTGAGRLRPIITCGNANTLAPASAATDTTIGTPRSSHATTAWTDATSMPTAPISGLTVTAVPSARPPSAVRVPLRRPARIARPKDTSANVRQVPRTSIVRRQANVVRRKSVARPPARLP